MYYQIQFTLLLIFYITYFQVIFAQDSGNSTTTTKGSDLTTAYTAKTYKLATLSDDDLKCKFQPYTYKCGDLPLKRSYSYDIQLQECVQTQYGNCKYGYNNFDSMSSCKATCKDVAHHRQPSDVPAAIYCRFQPEFGECHNYFPSYYYDVSLNGCVGFSFSGCGGNYNRFPTAKACKIRCEPLMTHEKQ